MVMSSTNNIFTAGVVRLIVILTFLFALIFLFKNDISRTMERGCFNLSLDVADAGLHISDQKLCTSEDLEQAAETLVSLGATNVGNEAEIVFEEYEAQITELVNKNNELAEQINRQTEVGKQIVDNNQSFGNYLNRLANERTNPAIVREIRDQYSESFGIVPEAITQPKISIVDPSAINKSTIKIRSDFNKKSKTTTSNINSNLKIKR